MNINIISQGGEREYLDKLDYTQYVVNRIYIRSGDIKNIKQSIMSFSYNPEDVLYYLKLADANDQLEVFDFLYDHFKMNKNFFDDKMDYVYGNVHCFVVGNRAGNSMVQQRIKQEEERELLIKVTDQSESGTRKRRM